MAALKKRTNFLASQEGVEAERLLRQMTTDSAYNTHSTYSTNSGLYPDGRMPFVDKHMNYLLAHPAINSLQYLSNLRLMTRIR